MNWEDQDIINSVKEIRKDSEYLSEQQMKEKHAQFIEEFPKLYYTCISPSFSYDMLTSMLRYRKKAKDENIPDLVRDATIGEEMAKKYLYPVVGEPTLEQKKEAAKKVAAKYNSM